MSSPDAHSPKLTGALVSLGHMIQRYSTYGMSTDGSAVVLAPMPWVAPKARAFWIYEPLMPAQIPSGCPLVYRTVLTQMNGCFAFDLSLYGVPSPNGLLNRSTLRPLSLVSANQHWRRGFVGGENLFHFGSGPFSESENVGYFFDGEEIVALRKHRVETGRWSSFENFLTAELSRAEQVALSKASAQAVWRESGA